MGIFYIYTFSYMENILLRFMKCLYIENMIKNTFPIKNISLIGHILAE